MGCVAWADLPAASRHALEVLGESEAAWDVWEMARDGLDRPAAKFYGAGASSKKVLANTNDTRRWADLSLKQQAAATALGLSEKTWDQVELANMESVANELFGPNFEGCVTQGCDVDSIDAARDLALMHPKVFASFGCHPKGAWTYDDALEKRFLAALGACGRKAVAWGEFGLDYSHPTYGKTGQNRRQQREVFARQLRLAIGKGLPLVIHSRAADRDTLRMMRHWVPRNWRVHVHAFRGTVPFLEALLEEWQHVYMGFSGIVALNDLDSQDLVRRCPVERMLLETDAPYLPVRNAFFSHPGHVPDIAAKVAEIKGVDVYNVLATTRANARLMYGI